MTRILTCLGLCTVLLSSSTSAAQDREAGVNKHDFFPFSTWYSGGKARAPQSRLPGRNFDPSVPTHGTPIQLNELCA